MPALPSPGMVRVVAPLLADPVRAVRIAAEAVPPLRLAIQALEAR